MSSCQPESRYGIPDGGEARVSIQFSMLGNEVVLRATEEAGRVEEDVIDHVDLYIFNKSTRAFVKHQSFDKTALTKKVVGTSTFFEVKATVIQGAEYTFVALANMPDGSTYSATPTINDLKQMGLPSALPSSPFVMFGQTDATIDANTGEIEIPVSRSCAGIDLVVDKDANFTLEEGFWIYNLEQNGYVDVADPSTVTGFASSLSPEMRLEGKTARAYTHPRNITVSDATPATYIIFKGKLSNGKSSYYRTEVNVQNGVQELRRNHLYRVIITKVTDLGYATLEEAKAATADKKVVYTVSDWDNKNESSVSFFGNYFLKLEKRSFFFDYAQQSESVEVVTNAPGIAITPPGEMAVDVDGNKTFTNSVAGWCAVKEAFLDEVNGIRRYLLNVGVFENLEKEEMRSAGFYVSATGIHTDDLKVLADIDQVNFNYYLPYTPNFKLTPDVFYDSSQDESEYVSTITLPLSRQEWIVEGYIDDVDNPIIASIADKNGVITTFAAPDSLKRRINKSKKRSIGDGKITIRTNKLADDVKRKPRVARVLVASGEGGKRYEWWLNIFQDFNLKYDITYPESVSDQMKRKKYVIETPLFETNPLTYDIEVTSNTSWRAEILPKEAESWVSFDPDTRPEHQHAAGNYSDETTSFKVIVKPNDQPLEEGYPPARQATVRVVCYQGTGAEEVVFRTANIIVYQGGYVKIGEDIWLDRNLKTGYRYSNSDYPMLYPYAIPVGLPTDVYGAYALNNTTLNPTNKNQNGDDGFFVSGASQSGYSSNNYNYYYRGSNLTYSRVSLIGGGENAWNEKGLNYQPCPPGWGVPKRSQWEFIGNLVNSGYGYGYGKPHDISLDPEISAQNGDMMVRNSGRYITVDPADSTNSGLIDWYLPAAGNRLFNGVSLQFSGVYGNYKLANGYTDDENNDHFVFTHNRAYFDQQNEGVASSVRCVRVK